MEGLRENSTAAPPPAGGSRRLCSSHVAGRGGIPHFFRGHNPLAARLCSDSGTNLAIFFLPGETLRAIIPFGFPAAFPPEATLTQRG